MPARARKAVEPVPTDETEDARRKRLLRKAYGEATQALRERHRGDFEGLYEDRAKALGVDWHPRPSAEQKAEEQFEALVEAYPYLLDRVDALRDKAEPDEAEPGDDGE